MSCADVCVMMDYDGDNAFYAEKIITARKPHTCCECGEVIAVGAQYERASGKSDGAIFTALTCLTCREVRRVFCCGGWEFGELWSSICEQLFPEWKRSGPWDCLAKLDTDEARAKMNAQYRWWADEDELDAATGQTTGREG